MVCGKFKESICKTITLHDVEEELFLKLLALACGKGMSAENIEELLDLGGLAERLQMEAVRTHVEDMLSKEMTEENCAELIQRSEARGLEQLQRTCYKMLRDTFEVVARKDEFLNLSEETMCDLLEEDELGAREEDVFEALVRWMTRNGEGLRGTELLRKIRYGVVGDKYLAEDMLSALPGLEMLKQLIGEAMVKKAKGIWDGMEHLCGKWMVTRRMKSRLLAADLLKNPAYVAIDQEDGIVVSDRTLHQIIVLSPFESIARVFGARGAVVGHFNYPMGVAVDRQGRIVIADSGNCRIQVLNADGTVARCFGSEGNGLGQLGWPHGVAIDREGHIVVSDTQNHRIQVFDQDESVVRSFGSFGTAIGQFMYPMGVAVDGANRIVVADQSNHRVQIFNCDGSVALSFGSYGAGPGQLNSPYDVAVDREGGYIVADCGNDRLQIFGLDGTVARVIEAAGDAIGLREPFGVAVKRAGRIVVAESGFNNHRLRVI